MEEQNLYTLRILNWQSCINTCNNNNNNNNNSKEIMKSNIYLFLA